MIVTQNLNRIIIYSQDEAERLMSPAVEAEHFLLAILRLIECSAYDLLLRAHFRPQEAKEQIEESVRGEGELAEQVQRSTQAERILRIAEGISREYNADAVGSAHLLLAIMREEVNSAAAYLEETWGLSYQQLVELYGQPHYSADAPTAGSNQMGDVNDPSWQPKQPQPKSKKNITNVLDKYGRDLTKQAEEGKLDPVVGREVEIERVVQILSRRKKNNPILIGEPGVGKSAIVEGLALRIMHDQTGVLAGKRIVTLDLASMVAGTTYRGQFEERMKHVIDELLAHPEIILFIDEIHTIIGAGNSSGSLDAANILKPALARGEIQCIGATTTAEFAKSIEKDGALERRFQKVPIRPTTGDETLDILKQLSDHYAHYHHVVYTAEVLKACVALSERYLTDRAFPDKAIDVMDEVGARSHVRESMPAKSKPDEVYTITPEDVAGVVSMMSGVPVQRVATQENTRLRTMGETLRQKIIGQDKAVETVVKAIQRSRLGLRDPKRPIGTFFFLGQTGVGKTYLAQCLAEEMFGSKDAIIRFDMSEYMEKHTVSLLVGAPPGYVAHEDGGKLTEAVRRKPYSIILFDEIEKAHPDIFNILLQVLDEGRLTDRQGHVVDFRNTIIVLTSNVGTRQLLEFGGGVGFGQEQPDQKQTNKMLVKALQKQFPPEFVNRIDNIVTFEPLSRETIGQIVRIEISLLQERLKHQGHRLSVTPEAIGEIVEKSFDTKNGARPVKRAVQTYLEDPLTEILLRRPNQKRITIKKIQQTV